MGKKVTIEEEEKLVHYGWSMNDELFRGFCDDDMVLEFTYTTTSGLYWNVEIGEDPTGWI